MPATSNVFLAVPFLGGLVRSYYGVSLIQMVATIPAPKMAFDNPFSTTSCSFPRPSSLDPHALLSHRFFPLFISSRARSSETRRTHDESSRPSYLATLRMRSFCSFVIRIWMESPLSPIPVRVILCHTMIICSSTQAFVVKGCKS